MRPGNRTTLAAPAVRTVVHRGTPNGGDGAVVKRTGRYTVTTSFAKRRPTLKGTLTRDGAPIAGAVLDVLAKIRVSGANMTKIAEVRTDANGAYSVKVPGGPSRLLRVAYKAYLGDTEYASWTDVSQRVRARVDFRAVTRQVGLRGRARFAGKVRGGYVPRRGKLIELQAYDAGRWRTFRTVRTSRSGSVHDELLLQARRCRRAASASGRAPATSRAIRSCSARAGRSASASADTRASSSTT